MNLHLLVYLIYLFCPPLKCQRWLSVRVRLSAAAKSRGLSFPHKEQIFVFQSLFRKRQIKSAPSQKWKTVTSSLNQSSTLKRWLGCIRCVCVCENDSQLSFSALYLCSPPPHIFAGENFLNSRLISLCSHILCAHYSFSCHPSLPATEKTGGDGEAARKGSPSETWRYETGGR